MKFFLQLGRKKRLSDHASKKFKVIIAEKISKFYQLVGQQNNVDINLKFRDGALSSTNPSKQ